MKNALKTSKKQPLIWGLVLLFLYVISCKNKKEAPKGESPITSVEALIDFMKTQKSEDQITEFTFVQETVHFNEEGQPQDTSTWYEAIRYPTEFRIDFGDPENRNANINRNDSIYVFRKDSLVHSGPEIQEFLILEGGLFHYSTAETLERLKSLGIDTSILNTSEYNGKPVYILGSTADDTSKPQIWVDAKELYVVRRFSQGKQGELYEVKYDDFKNIEGHWIETWIEFHVDGRLIQTERYNDIDLHPDLDDKVFDPKAFGASYWFKN
ncbi:hypothetical protein J0X14_11935 [Muricauda sp. CAU 1633]|uniref:hypothetical protein n=1 Tax=Allomuricauda sp. CAU 1633 TaxID=2816036 RepID=UPI001A8C1472|nr:hypothetical protein [Muricauda sp. CAU 1633]MBO0323008.1 hypothetical protein [Muricauda sp. CAU 1633]